MSPTEYAIVVKVHRHGKGAKGDSEPGHRPLQSGMTTKIPALTDALGNLVSFEWLPGHRFDTVGVEPLLQGMDFGG